MRKICVVIGSRANYSSIKSALKSIQVHPKLELQIVANASAVLDKYGNVAELIENDGFTDGLWETSRNTFNKEVQPLN